MAPDLPAVETNMPASSNVLTNGTATVPALNVIPAVGTIGVTVALPTVAPGVPRPMTTWPALLLIKLIPTLPPFTVVGPQVPTYPPGGAAAGVHVTKSPVP